MRSSRGLLLRAKSTCGKLIGLPQSPRLSLSALTVSMRLTMEDITPLCALVLMIVRLCKPKPRTVGTAARPMNIAHRHAKRIDAHHGNELSTSTQSLPKQASCCSAPAVAILPLGQVIPSWTFPARTMSSTNDKDMLTGVFRAQSDRTDPLDVESSLCNLHGDTFYISNPLIASQ
jgi:hypothetical protein